MTGGEVIQIRRRNRENKQRRTGEAGRKRIRKKNVPSMPPFHLSQQVRHPNLKSLLHHPIKISIKCWSAWKTRKDWRNPFTYRKKKSRKGGEGRRKTRDIIASTSAPKNSNYIKYWREIRERPPSSLTQGKRGSSRDMERFLRSPRTFLLPGHMVSIGLG